MEKRIAMWSGPRNLSTAMMRAFENRPDCRVVDEPFYAAFLHATQIEHPMHKEIIAAGETDPVQVANECAQGNGLEPVFYQKQMTHHMLPDFPLAWLSEVTNLFLIRAPERVLASYNQIRTAPTLADIGFEQQARIYKFVTNDLGQKPLIIEAEDVRLDPEAMMRTICDAVQIPFSTNMLSWPTGRRATDGIWAPFWYKSVEASTRFSTLTEIPDLPQLSPDLSKVANQARPFFEELQSKKLKI